MNSYRILAVATGIVLAGSLGTGVALAQGPNSEECENAVQAVANLEVELRDAVFNERKAEEEALAEANENLRNANLTASDGSRVDPTQEELDRLRSIREQDPFFDIAQEKIALIENFFRLQGIVEDAEAALNSENADTAGIRARLNLALQDRDRECADPEPTATPAPTTTVVVPPPVVEDDNAPVPSGGVDTGDGSSL